MNLEKEKNSLIKCPKCNYKSARKLINGDIYCSPCATVEIEEGRKQAEIKAKEDTEKYLNDCKKNNYDKFLQGVGIPKKYLNVQSHEEKRSLLISGNFGTGKTYYAISAIKHYIENLPASCFVEPFTNIPRFVTIPDLLLKIRATFSLERCEEEIVDKYANTQLLVLDDLGVEKTTEFSLQTLYIILNRRYNEQLQTIITSNLTLDEVKDKLGDRIASRIAGMCRILKLNGKDKRLDKLKK